MSTTIYDSVIIVFFKRFCIPIGSFQKLSAKKVISPFRQAIFFAFTPTILRYCFYCKCVVTENVAADYTFHRVVIQLYAPLSDAVFFSCLLTEYQVKADIWHSFILKFANFWASDLTSFYFAFWCIQFILAIQKLGAVLKLVIIFIKI